MSLSQDRLKALLRYEPESGLFIRISGHPYRPDFGPGSVAGSVNNHGYIAISVDGRTYSGHRLAVPWMTGAWPTQQVDHMNGNRSDNKWKNLREVSASMNRQNQRNAKRNSKSGLLGVSWSEASKKFQASIYVNGRLMHLGMFGSDVEAHEAYLSKKRELHAGNTL